MGMNALTIYQPYASWIINGKKWVENRLWSTGYRGRLAIHAGLCRDELRRLQLDPDEYPRGVILGTVRLAGVLHLDDLRNLPLEHYLSGVSRSVREVLDHPHTTGPYCWILHDPNPYETPIAAVGLQRLWKWAVTDVAGD